MENPCGSAAGRIRAELGASEERARAVIPDACTTWQFGMEYRKRLPSRAAGTPRRTAMNPPVKIEPHAEVLPFRGGTLIIGDRAQLVGLVARLVLGQHLHVESVLTGVPAVDIPVTSAMIDRASQQLTSPADVYHRDGWIFQMISWIAARSASADRTLAAPHMQPTRQGFDCLYLELPDGATPMMTICEDKATENSRDKIRDEVFAFFGACERGHRDAELLAELTVLLQRRQDRSSIDSIINAVQWERVRNYSASITAEPAVAARVRALFDGYTACVAGDDHRRTAIVFSVEDLRSWMTTFCAEVVAAMRSLAPPAPAPAAAAAAPTTA